MGKKVKKKMKSGQKEKRSFAPPKTPSESIANVAGTPDNGVAVGKDRRACSHIVKGVCIDKLSARLKSRDSLGCEDCRGDVLERRANRVKGKPGKKGGTNSKSESKAIWICLGCGHFSCGGVGLPTTPQSHAVRHAKQCHHPLAVHHENHQLMWCFPCSRIISVEKSEDTQEQELLREVVKLLKAQPDEGSSVDVEDVWFGGGSVTSAVKSGHSFGVDADPESGYLVRGLVNLGNTCFFNSIMQNLLAINKLRNYFFELDESIGPLTAALRKLFAETSAEAGTRGAINPRSLFGSLCTKAPQFRGYQQHDSHELLRCLLDGLSTEELSVRKNTRSSQADQKASITDPTFVDTIFGGQLSSTVTCLECGHSSTVHEPFLDLSLPVPNKKAPPKKVQPVARGKKPKLPPKRIGKVRPKISRDTNALPAESVSDQSTGANSSGEVQSTLQLAEHLVLKSGDSALSDSIDSNAMALEMGLTPQGLSDAQSSRDQPVEDVRPQTDSFDYPSWFDYLDPTPASTKNEVASETDEISINQVLNDDILDNASSLPITLDSIIRNDSGNTSSETPFNSKQLDPLDQGVPAQQSSGVSECEDKKSAISGFDEKLSPEDSLTKEVLQLDAGLCHSSDSRNQFCSENSNLGTHSSGKEDDHPLQVQDSEVLFLPYKEDVSPNVELKNWEAGASSAVVGDEQDSLGFDGFGDLFNEPEDTSELGTSDRLVSHTGDAVNTGVVNGNSSDSDPNEVDDTNDPVSVERCLGFFMKSEFLSKDEHAWHCDNCSKVLREQKTRSRKLQKRGSKIVPNGFSGKTSSGLVDVGRINNEVGSINGNSKEDIVDVSCGTLSNKEIDANGNCMPENQPETEVNVTSCQSEKKEPETINTSNGAGSSLNCQNLDSANYEDCDPKNVKIDETDSLAPNSESEVSEEEEVNTKVKRDATKSILINKAPSVLTIHLKRFSQDSRGRLSKLNGHVNLKETIDLKPYMDPRNTDRDTHTYRLVGVVEHSGTMRGGHYVGYVRGGSKNYKWYHASDAYVREASLEEVLRSEAYILFYEEGT